MTGYTLDRSAVGYKHHYDIILYGQCVIYSNRLTAIHPLKMKLISYTPRQALHLNCFLKNTSDRVVSFDVLMFSKRPLGADNIVTLKMHWFVKLECFFLATLLCQRVVNAVSCLNLHCLQIVLQVVLI